MLGLAKILPVEEETSLPATAKAAGAVMVVERGRTVDDDEEVGVDGVDTGSCLAATTGGGGRACSRGAGIF